MAQVRKNNLDLRQFKRKIQIEQKDQYQGKKLQNYLKEPQQPNNPNYTVEVERRSPPKRLPLINNAPVNINLSLESNQEINARKLSVMHGSHIASPSNPIQVDKSADYYNKADSQLTAPYNLNRNLSQGSVASPRGFFADQKSISGLTLNSSFKNLE